jgi:hypothetical protein
MEIPDFLLAPLSNLSLFAMSSKLRIKLQIGKETTQNSATDNRCHSMPSLLSHLVQGQGQKLKITYLLSYQRYIHTKPIMATEAEN